MSFFTSLTGLNAATAQLGVTSNNIANASTVGFKRSRADFGDIFATSPLQKATSTIGQGVSLKRVTQEFGQGNMNFSSNTLDLAISGDGFFPLKSGDGFQDIFTRNGSFMMNDQYNVVNSAGQRLMAASVDSTGKANLSDMNVLTIPQKTTGMAKETSLVQLGLNFPADAQVVTTAFNRNDPATYNKSTALTVYDKGGNGYLATVYYAKTQNASQADPNNKWQTYVYVGDTLVAAALQQATDTTGEPLYVNKYGQLKPESEVGDLLVNAKTQKFSLNQLTDQRTSEPATVTGGKTAVNLTTLNPINFENYSSTQLASLFSIDVDGSGSPVSVGLENLAGKPLKLSGTEVAKELTNVLNRKFGDERYFNFGSDKQENFQIGVTNTDGSIEYRNIQLDTANMTYEQVVDKINGQLGSSGVVLSNVTFSTIPAQSDFTNYAFTLTNSAGSTSTVEGMITWPATTLSQVPMEDLATGLQNSIRQQLQKATTATPPGLAMSAEDAAKISVNVQNGNEIRINDVAGNTLGALSLFKGGSGSTLGTTAATRSDVSIVGSTTTAGVPSASSLTLSNVTMETLKPNASGTGTIDPGFTSFDLTIGSVAASNRVVISGESLGLIVGNSPMEDLAAQLKSKIQTYLKTKASPVWTEAAANKVQVAVVNGKDIKITDSGGNVFEGFTLNKSGTTTSTVSAGGKNLSYGPMANQVKASYDPATQQFSFAPVVASNVISLIGVNEQLGLTGYTEQTAGSDSLNSLGLPLSTNDYIRPFKLQRTGLKVEYDTVNQKFVFKSGTTGDNSSIAVSNPSSFATENFGLAADGQYEVKTSQTALRGLQSNPAVMTGSPMGINPGNNFSVDLTNNRFVVSVDDVKGTVVLEPKSTYTIDSFVQALQNGINNLAGPPDQSGLTGSTVSGVKVSYDSATNSLKFTTGTASSNSFIKVSGDTQWGLSNSTGARGSSSTWVKPTQYTQTVNGVQVAQYIDEFGKETFSPDGFKALPEWSPIFLEKGELTFDTGGNLVSPKQGSQLDTVYLPDGKGALTININYSKSTQFSSPYAVLSQSQDGAPEGDLVGLSVGDDGLVNASYSNGSQKSLGKVVLVNFSNPTGLRQIGDTSYYKSSSSGSPKYGEAGSAGFGTVRAGATERANVDLTQELVDLITEQRNFQANAKAIETSTTLTQSIIQIRA
jgi:flagellar hook-basal body protein